MLFMTKVQVFKLLKPLLLFHVIIVISTFNCGTGLAPGSWHQYNSLQETDSSVKDRLTGEIQKFYGAPYVWGGDSPQGTDCSGMVKTIYQNAVQINLPHNANEMSKLGVGVSKNRLIFGDLVFFSDMWNGRATHMGIYIDRGYFLHASSSRGVILSKLNDNPYKRQFVGAKRIIDH